MSSRLIKKVVMTGSRRKVHYAWVVLGAVVFVVFCTSGLRGSFGVFIKPLEAEFGWTRSTLSGVASLSLLLWGAIGPVVGYLADHWGPRRVILVGSFLLGIGSILSAEVSSLWQLCLTAGLFMPWALGDSVRPSRQRSRPAGSKPAEGWRLGYSARRSQPGSLLESH